jgi:hypothetical protein
MSSVTAVPIPPVKPAYKMWLWIGLLIAVAAAFGLAWMGTRAVVAAKGTNDQFLAWNKTQPGVQTTKSGLQYQIIKPGEGATATDGDGVSLTIEGKKRNGEVFQPKGPLRYQVGVQPMIPGFAEAVKLMNKGAQFRVWLPPKLGFDSSPGGAPPEFKDQLLIFDIKMDERITAAEIQAMQAAQAAQQGGAPGGPPGGAPGEAPPEGAVPKQ